MHLSVLNLPLTITSTSTANKALRLNRCFGEVKESEVGSLLRSQQRKLLQPMLSLNLTHLIDDAKCYETIRQMRWSSGVCCPKCHSPRVIKRGKDETQPHRQRYQCKTCSAHFDDLTDTIFAGHHQPLRMWVLCLYLMGLNLSNQQISQELDLDKDVVQDMTTLLRHGIIQRNPEVTLSGAVECDEV